jgi:hypothetical protein
MRNSRCSSFGLLVLLTTTAVQAQAPRDRVAVSQSTYSVPAAALPGATTEVRFFNAPAGAGTGLWTSFGAEATPVPGATGGAAAYRLKLPADAPVGVGAVRVATTGGLAGVQLFMIDDLPTVSRSGKNRSPAGAQAIEPSCAVDGAVDPLTSDFYRMAVRRGQRIAFEVVAQRLGSRMDPLVRVLDSSGRELAFCDDTTGLGADSRFAHTFDRDGEVVVEVRDANYEGSSDHRYRLRVGDFPTVTTAFPVGAKGGAAAAFEFVGPVGDRVGPIKYDLPGDTPRFPCAVKYPNGRSSAFVPVRCGEHDEFVAAVPNHAPETAARLALPASVSGRFDTSGVRDFYEIAAKKGERIVVRGQTRRWGSPVDLYFAVHNAGGSKIAETKIAEYKPAVKGALPPPPDEGQLEFAAPADGAYRFSVEDLNRAGGPGMVYRLDVDRAGKTFTLAVDVDKIELTPGGMAKLKVKADRQGYDGPINLSVRGAPAGVTLGKKASIAAGKNEVDLEMIAPADYPAAGTPTQFTVVGVGGGPDAPERVASTAAPIRRMFPRMMFIPLELDGPIGLLVRKPAAGGSKTPAK